LPARIVPFRAMVSGGKPNLTRKRELKHEQDF
jgi:hypothetical protein